MKKFFSARKGLLVFAGLLLSISTVSAAPKANNLKFKLGQMAENIAKFLKDDLNQSKVRMGRFSALTSVQSSAGTGMAKTLADSLKKHGITVSKISAPVIVQGEFEDVTDSVSGHLALHVKVKLLDTKTKRKLSTQDFQVGIFGEENLAKHLGPTVDLPPKGTPKDRNKKLQHSLDKPNATVTGKSIVSAKKDSHYAIELLVKRNGKYVPVGVSLEDGIPIAGLKRDDVYGVRLINNHPTLEAAVGLSIDGMSMFEFSDVRHTTGVNKGDPKFRFLLIPPKGSFLVRGWHIDNDKSAEFKVTQLSESAYAKRFPGQEALESVGMINATFGAAWPKGSPTPPDEPKKGIARSANATGFGQPIKQKYRPVKRDLGVLRASVTLRYLRDE